jgi:short-chain Z-isoprenyl diphosphate synthase
MAPFLRFLYFLYERRLLKQVRRGALPRHIGIILDGNRRHGRARGLVEPHDWCGELGILVVTLWVFSTENFQRPSAEVSGIFSAVAAKLTALAKDPAIHRRRVRVRAIGRLSSLPESVMTAIGTAEKATASYDGMELNIAVAYGGRQEITDAVKVLLADMAADGVGLSDAVAAVTPEAIATRLYTAGLPDPDLIIRTSGEIRLSGFLLWQSAHSEFYFTDVLWPAFRRIDFLRAIRAYQERHRRFGA